MHRQTVRKIFTAVCEAHKDRITRIRHRHFFDGSEQIIVDSLRMTEKTTITRHTRRFPEVLFEMLEEADKHPDIKNVVSWLPCGTRFQIHIRSTFVNMVLPHFFKNAKYKSFNRQLNLYKFQRCSDGNNMRRARGVYAHPKFQRDRPDLLVELKRDPVFNKDSGGHFYSSMVDRGGTTISSKLKKEYRGNYSTVVDIASSTSIAGGGGVVVVGLLPPMSSSITTTTTTTDTPRTKNHHKDDTTLSTSSSNIRQYQIVNLAAGVLARGRRRNNMSCALYYPLFPSTSREFALEQQRLCPAPLPQHHQFFSSQQQQENQEDRDQSSPPTEQDIINEIILTFGK